MLFLTNTFQTGKTHTLIELILQMLKRNLRVLVCGPSNISVDNIVERLAPHKIPIIRLGHPARLLPSVLNHSLDVLTRTSEAGNIVKDIRAEMDAKQASIRKTRTGRERKAIYGELKVLRKEYRERERRCVSSLVASSKVVLATLHGAGGFQLRDENFDVVIIDEASQALEAQCWVPLLSAKKAVCAGDHLQLPPTIKSLKGTKKPSGDGKKGAVTLETTLFDRLLALHGPSIKRMLTTQYRMHENIMRFPSDVLYESKLVAADSVKDRLLKGLPYEVKSTDDSEYSIEEGFLPFCPFYFCFENPGTGAPPQTQRDIRKSRILTDIHHSHRAAHLHRHARWRFPRAERRRDRQRQGQQGACAEEPSRREQEQCVRISLFRFHSFVSGAGAAVLGPETQRSPQNGNYQLTITSGWRQRWCASTCKRWSKPGSGPMTSQW